PSVHRWGGRSRTDCIGLPWRPPSLRGKKAVVTFPASGYMKKGRGRERTCRPSGTPSGTRTTTGAEVPARRAVSPERCGDGPALHDDRANSAQTGRNLG